MGDQLSNLLRERFSGHETDVPPRAWEHVSGQLAASASGNSLRESLQDKFSGHEVEVDPSAWANISGQLGHGAAAGTSIGTGWMMAGAVAVAITAAVALWNFEGNAPVREPAKPQVAAATTQVEPEPALSMPETAPAETEAETTVPSVMPQAETDAPEPATAQEPKAIQAEPAPPISARDVMPERPAAEHRSVPATAAPALPAVDGETTKKETTKQTAPAIGAADQKTAQQPEATTKTIDKPVDGKQTGASEPTTSPTEVMAAPPAPGSTTDASHIFIPNTFTPNGDGHNDIFLVPLQDYNKADLRIFSARTGNLVFQTNDLNKPWDSRLANGNYAEAGYYQCVVNWTDRSGHPHSENVTLSLFR